MTIERTITTTNSEIPTLDAALSWVVQTLDREFKDATMVKVAIEQYLYADSDEAAEGTWTPAWNAAVSGCQSD